MSLAELHAIEAKFAGGRRQGDAVTPRGKSAAHTRRKSTTTQALWNAAAESPESRAAKAAHKVTTGVPLKGAYRGYHAAQQVSYLPPDFHGQADKARTEELWDAAENDDSLAGTREKLGMAPRAARGKASVDLSGTPRNYLAGMDYRPPDYLAGQGW
jgi:hypothetical protein